MKKWITGFAMALLCAVAWALPSVDEVEAQVKAGHYVQAEAMMKEVVAAKPGSAKGHYVYAELLARNGNFTEAAAQAAKAKEIDPSLGFTSPDKFRSFQQLLQREQNPPARREAPSSMSSSLSSIAPAAAPAPVSRSSGIPTWVWGAGLAVVALMLWRGLSSSRNSAPGAVGSPTYANGMGGPQYPNPGAYPAPGQYPPGAGPYNAPFGPGVAPSAGGGLLRTGAAIAAGAAGGMLLDEALRRREPGTDQLSGLQRGVFDGPQYDNSAANELENRNVDFGNGSDWDSSNDTPDLGGGGGDSGGGWD